MLTGLTAVERDAAVWRGYEWLQEEGERYGSREGEMGFRGAVRPPLSPPIPQRAPADPRGPHPRHNAPSPTSGLSADIIHVV